MEKKDLLRFKSIPTLRTDRLRLRRMEKCDLYDVFKYTSDPEVPKYLLDKHYYRKHGEGAYYGQK